VIFLKPFVVTLLALLALDLLLPNVTTGNWLGLLIASVVLTLLTEVVKPVLSIFLLPITIITLGIFNTILTFFLMWLATVLVPGFHVDPLYIGGYWLGQWVMLLVFAFLLSITKSVILKVWR